MKRITSPKKRTVGVLERDGVLRAAWKVMVAEQVEAKRLVFVDEMGTNTSSPPTFAWAKKGQRPTDLCLATEALTLLCFRA